MLDGSGFLVWKLYKLFPFEATADKLASMGVSWLSIKALDGAVVWNQTDATGKYNGSPELMLSAVSIFKSRGIDVGAWGFPYTDGVSQYNQATKVGQVVSQFGFTHWLIDAEDVSTIGARWKTHPDRKALANAYMQYLNTPSGFPVGLCTYRYLSYHPEFPFTEFAGHYKTKFNAPQVYWMFSHNPGYQVRKSAAEYAKFNKPFIPIGASFCEHGWCPTAGEIREFIDASNNDLHVQGYGFWALDDALARQDWLDEIATTPLPEPPPPPPPPVPSEYARYKVNVSSLNVRDNIIPSRLRGPVPGTIYYPSKIWFAEPTNTEVVALEEKADGLNQWVRVGRKQWMAKLYDGSNFLVEI